MAKPGPKPSGCINEVKLMLTNEDFDDLRLFMAMNGISSLSESGRVALRRFFRGVLGSLPNLAPFVTPDPANCRPPIPIESAHGH